MTIKLIRWIEEIQIHQEIMAWMQFAISKNPVFTIGVRVKLKYGSQIFNQLTSTIMNLKQFKFELRLVSGKHDLWGNAMEAWFECAGRMNRRGLNIPVEWQYRPALGSDGTDKDSYWYSLFGRCGNKQLQTIGNFLTRYCQMLKYYKQDY